MTQFHYTSYWTNYTQLRVKYLHHLLERLSAEGFNIKLTSTKEKLSTRGSFMDFQQAVFSSI